MTKRHLIDLIDPDLDDESKVRLFCTCSSLNARKLAGLMSVVPVELPIVDLIRKKHLPESTQAHVDEVFRGGLIRSFSLPDGQQGYDFLSADVRHKLSCTVSIPSSLSVIETVAGFFSERVGLEARGLKLLAIKARFLEPEQQSLIRPFIEMSIDYIRGLPVSSQPWLLSAKRLTEIIDGWNTK